MWSSFCLSEVSMTIKTFFRIAQWALIFFNVHPFCDHFTITRKDYWTSACIMKSLFQQNLFPVLTLLSPLVDRPQTKSHLCPLSTGGWWIIQRFFQLLIWGLNEILHGKMSVWCPGLRRFSVSGDYYCNYSLQVDNLEPMGFWLTQRLEIVSLLTYTLLFLPISLKLYQPF